MNCEYRNTSKKCRKHFGLHFTMTDIVVITIICMHIMGYVCIIWDMMIKRMFILYNSNIM